MESLGIDAAVLHRDLRANGVRAAGEEHTGRREVLTLVELVNCHPRGSGPGPTATLQLVQSDTGETTAALLLPAIQKIRDAR